MGIKPPELTRLKSAKRLSRRPNNELAVKSGPSRNGCSFWLLLISALVITADRLTKTWIAAHIPLGHAIPIIPHFLRLTHWTNEGGCILASSADSASPNGVRWALVAFTVAAAVAIFVLLIRLGGQFTLAPDRCSRAHSRRRARQRPRPHSALRLSHRLH